MENKLRQLLTKSTICNIVSQPRTRFRFREAMDSGNVLVCDLARGRHLATNTAHNFVDGGDVRENEKR